MIIAWQIWLVVAVVFLIIEILNAGFGIVCLSFGAFLSAILAACGLGLMWQIAGFAVGSFLSFLFIRPVLVRWLDARKNDTKINLDNMIGRKAIVIEPVDSTNGRVAIDGTDWKATTSLSEPIEKGASVTIIARQGNTLKVAI